MNDDLTALAEAVGVLDDGGEWLTLENLLGCLTLAPLFICPLITGSML